MEANLSDTIVYYCLIGLELLINGTHVWLLHVCTGGIPSIGVGWGGVGTNQLFFILFLCQPNNIFFKTKPKQSAVDAIQMYIVVCLIAQK